MEKAWIDFEIDEESFKLIIKSEEEFIVDMLKKKYGRDFDGINVKSAIKKSEFYKYSLAEQCIKLDVLCIKKLKEANKNIEGFFGNNTNIMSRKLCLAYGINPLQLDKAVTHIQKEAHDSFVYIFGVNRKKMKMSMVTSMLDITTDELYKNMDYALKQITTNIKNSVSQTQEKKPSFKIPTLLITEYKKHGYDEDTILKAISSFDGKIALILRKYYGLNYKTAKSPFISVPKSDEELLKEVFTGEENLEVRINNLDKYVKVKTPTQVKKKSFNLIKYYENEGYRKHDIISAYRSLSVEDREFLKQEFDNNFSRKFNENLTIEEKDRIYMLTRSKNSGIGKYLADLTEQKKKQEKQEKILEESKKIEDYYKEKGATEEQVKTLLDKLKEEDSKTYNDTVDENGTIKNRFTYKNTKEERDRYRLFVTNGLKYLKMIQNGEEVKPKKIEEKPKKQNDEPEKLPINTFKNIRDYYRSLGYDDKKIDKLIECLKERYSKEYNSYVDSKGNIKHKGYSAGTNYIFTKKAIKILDSINTEDETIKIKSRNYTNIKTYYKDNGYNDEEISKLLEILKNGDSDLYEDCIDFDGNILKPIWANIKNRYYFIIKGTRYINMIRNNEKVTVKPKISKHLVNTKIEDFYKKMGYTEEEIKMLLDKLKEKDSNVYNDTIAEDGTILKELSENTTEEEKKRNELFLETSSKIIKKMRDKQNRNLQNNKYSNIKDFYKDKGATDKQIEVLLETLKKEEPEVYSKIVDEDGTILKDFINYITEEEKAGNILFNKKGLNYLRSMKKPKIKDYYKARGYTEEQVDKVLTMLKEKDPDTYNDTIAEDGTILKSFSSHRTKAEGKRYSLFYYYGLKCLAEITAKSNSIINIKDIYMSNGYTEEESIKVLSKLKEENEELYNKHIDDEYNVRVDEAIDNESSELINKGFLELKKMHEDSKVTDNVDKTSDNTDSDIKEYIKYLKYLKHAKIFTKELILSLDIEKNDKYYLLMEFVLNSDNIFTLEEEANLLNIDIKLLIEILTSTIEKARKDINNKFKYKKTLN